MATITLHFQADSWGAIRQQLHEALGLDHPAQASTAPEGFPDDVNGDEGENFAERPLAETIQAREPAPKPKRTRAAKPAPTPEPEPGSGPGPEPEPEPEPEPTPETAPEPGPARDLPSIEALKAIVTQAVRLAQKKEGPARILELLPEFKRKTGLGFVMEAEEKHREALGDLIDEAGLVEATA